MSQEDYERAARSPERGTPVVLTLTEARLITAALSEYLTIVVRPATLRADISNLHQRFYDLVDILVDLQPLEGPPA